MEHQLLLKKIIRFLSLCLIPVLLLFVLYIYYDPFRILRTYKNYSSSEVVLNRDHVSTTMFLNNYKKNNYNSFIFGSSRTLGFRTKVWSKYLAKKDKMFVFDASNESIYGIYTKLKYLDLKKIKINNAIIVLCRDRTFEYDKNHEGHLFIKHPEISGESKLRFQFEFLKDYFSAKFLFCFYLHKVIKEYKPFMFGYIEDEKTMINSSTNEINLDIAEKQIKQSPTKYYLEKNDVFYKRKGEQIDSIQRINQKELFMLREVKRILEKNKTNYKVIISPLYEQIKFSRTDENILKTIFGAKLFDFSGKNKLTEQVDNYYESSHFRPKVGDAIFEVIYDKNLE